MNDDNKKMHDVLIHRFARAVGTGETELLTPTAH